MEEILDNVNEPLKNKSNYAKLSVVFSLITLGLLVFIIASIPAFLTVKNGMNMPSPYFAIAAMVSMFIGLTCTILSILKKERLPYYKAIFGLLNILFFLFFLFAVVFVQLIDLTR